MEEFDHVVLLMRAMETAPHQEQRGDRPFHFEEAWTSHKQCDAMVVDAWAEVVTGERAFRLFRKNWGTCL